MKEIDEDALIWAGHALTINRHNNENVTVFHLAVCLSRSRSHTLAMWTMWLCGLVNIHHQVTITNQITNIRKLNLN